MSKLPTAAGTAAPLCQIGRLRKILRDFPVEIGSNSCNACPVSWVMQMLVSKEAPESLSQSQRAALISLLVDDDPAIYQIVRRKILSYGQTACEWLQPHMLSSDPVMRRRAMEIVHHFARQGSDERFQDFCLHNGEELDLEMAVG